MKFVLQILFLLLVVTPVIPVYSEATPHLVLNFDINKTLIASDKAGNKLVDDVINELLAEKYIAFWDSSLLEEISFDDYVNKILIPGPKNDSELRRQRKCYLQRFLDYLRENNSPLYELAFSDYETALKVLESSQGDIFPSFYRLIEKLNEQQISYSIILRSFGLELFEVKQEINSFHEGLIGRTAEFQKGKLYLDSGEVIEDSYEIYCTLRSIGHIAIHDDWNYWNSHGLAAHQGKPFYVDREDSEILSIFFDDNIDEADSINNIISSLDANTNESIPIEEVVELGLAVRVDTLEAILNDNYFIERVEKAVEKANLRKFFLIKC